MLRTDFLALSAFHALVCALSAVAAYQPFFLMSCSSLVSVQCQIIHCCERSGNPDLHRTDFCTVVTGCTWNQRNFTHSSSCLVDGFFLAVSKTVKIFHKGKVIFHLCNVTHSGKYSDHAFQISSKRIAQDAVDASGSAAFKIFSTDSGGVASMPPFTGSMIMTGLPCFLATS